MLKAGETKVAIRDFPNLRNNLNSLGHNLLRPEKLEVPKVF